MTQKGATFMRHIVLFVSVLLFLLCAGCSTKANMPKGGEESSAGTSIMEVLGEDMLAIYESRTTKLPAAVIYIFQGNGERVESPLYGDADVNAVLDAIAEITITGETDRTVADSDTSYTFLNADGTEAGSISFNGDYLDGGGKKYEIENTKALGKIDFPAESDRDALTLDGPDPEMYEFLEKCKTEKPVSIRVVRDGAESVITVPETIEKAIDSLYSINFVMYSLQGTEPPATTLTAVFVMNDGWEYSLTLYDDSIYVYEYPEPLGAWSFYTDGAEYFTEALEGEK